MGVTVSGEICTVLKIPNTVNDLPEHPLPQLENAGRKVYPVAPQQHQIQGNEVETAAANFPAILQNSMDKLQMNFIQNKSISGAPLEYQVRTDDSTLQLKCV